jgi:prolyl-tRNA editing enzyme YbaK/EbsC (Cys-tRNA(Pro) deacylase)
MSGRERVAEFLNKASAQAEVCELETSTRNSELAARALGCTIAQIAKSVVFVAGDTVVVVISGDKRVDVAKLGRLMRCTARVATASEVKEKTGYPVGGVPPFPHEHSIRVITDASLLRFESVWAAAGVPTAVFSMSTRDLIRLTGSPPMDLALDPKDIAGDI